jgi:hypothetical protein
MSSFPFWFIFQWDSFTSQALKLSNCEIQTAKRTRWRRQQIQLSIQPEPSAFQPRLPTRSLRTHSLELQIECLDRGILLGIGAPNVERLKVADVGKLVNGHSSRKIGPIWNRVFVVGSAKVNPILVAGNSVGRGGYGRRRAAMRRRESVDRVVDRDGAVGRHDEVFFVIV